MFGTVLISSISLMHVYVFWRIATIPLIAQIVPRKVIVAIGLTLWLLFFFARVYGRSGAGRAAAVIEFAGMNWMGVLFLLFAALLTVDIATGFGFWLPRVLPALRFWALVAGCVLAAIALFQGMRPPVVRTYAVRIKNLPPELDGTVLVAMSDLHLGRLLGPRWLAARIAQVQAERPQAVLLLGDIFEGHGAAPDEFRQIFRRLSPPLGVWAVAGNHEFHGGRNGNGDRFKAAGIGMLRNRWVLAAPGLVLAGVEDLTTLNRSGQGAAAVRLALQGRPAGATVFLSHTPWQAEKAAAAGVDLMLSGHTHGGQIWPFGYLVRRAYPLLAGRYRVDDMPVIVCRGTGTWGPRMRLWQPGEILRITLHLKKGGI